MMPAINISEKIDEVLSDLVKKLKESGVTEVDKDTLAQRLLEMALESLSKNKEALKEVSKEETELDRDIEKLLNIYQRIPDSSYILKELKDSLLIDRLLRYLDRDDRRYHYFSIIPPDTLQYIISQVVTERILDRVFDWLDRDRRKREETDVKLLKYLNKLAKRIEKLEAKHPELAKEISKAISKVVKSLAEKKKHEEIKEELSKKLEELAKKLEAKEKEEERKAFEEKLNQLREQLMNAINMINQRIAYLEQQPQQPSIVEQLEQLRKLRDQVKVLAEAFNLIPKEPIVTKEGKVNWAALIEKGLETVKDIIATLKQSPPPYQPPQPLPFEQPQSSTEQVQEIKPIQQQVVTPQISEETKKEEKVETKEEKKEEKKEEVKIEAKEGEQIITDDNYKVTPFITLGDLKRKLGKEVYVKIKQDGRQEVCYKEGGMEVALSQAQLEQLEDEIFAEKLEKGEYALNLPHKSFEELLQDEQELSRAYMLASAGVRVKLADGTDVTDKVLEEGKKRGYPTFEEYARQVEGTQETGTG